MLKTLLPSVLAAALALVSLSGSGQTLPGQRGRNWCGAVAEEERYYAAHPGAREAQMAMYKQLEAVARRQYRGTAAAPDVTIPVVVHVIHAGGPDNISDRQINSAIDQLNADYQKLNADTASTLPLFRPIAASLGFQFRLAKKDPAGIATTGITRHYAPALINDNLSGGVQAVSIWDRNRYLNIWVVSSIGTATANSFVLGYSNLPQNSTSTRDGFVVRHDHFGNTGTSSAARALSRTATHEIGHYFGLRHPWGNGNSPEIADNCNDTDFVDDTPPTNGTFKCDLAYAPCGPVANVQNFMDYAACPTMFTTGQKALMRGVLSSIRTGLTTPANLAATGTNNGYVAPVSKPIAAFAVAPGTSARVCINSPVLLKDYSYNYSAAGGTPTYAWSFPGGTPSSSNSPTPSVRYATAGFYAVTETVTNTAGSSTATATNYIRVEGPAGGETAPFTQSFEAATFPNFATAPSLKDYELAGTTSAEVPSVAYRWVRQSVFEAAAGEFYLAVNNRLYEAGAVSTLITPNINLTATGAGAGAPAVLSFARAYALRTATSDDQLRVAFSQDCGATWSTPAVLDAVALSTQGPTPVDGYVPATSAEYQVLTVPIPAQFQGSGLFKVRLQMVNGSSAGNNFYFDNLRVGGPQATATKASALAGRGISVYPNPLTNETAVHLNLLAATQVQVRLTDLIGRDVLALPAKTYGAGPQTLPLPTAGRTLRAGVYVVRIALNGETFSSKLTVE